MSNAFTGGFEPGFLAGPEIEESGVLLIGRQRVEKGTFAGRKKAFYQFIRVGHRANLFHINANLAELGHGDKREVLRMGQVEKQCAFCKSASKCGLAVWAIDKIQPIRRAIQVLRKKHAQNSARGDKAIAKPFKAEAGRASLFFVGEDI